MVYDRANFSVENIEQLLDEVYDSTEDTTAALEELEYDLQLIQKFIRTQLEQISDRLQELEEDEESNDEGSEDE
jgi:DNA-binding transcriptional MerR regulator